MTALKTTFLLAALFCCAIACNNPATATVPVDDTTTKPERSEPATQETPVEVQGDRTTLEGFWARVLVAVANKDKETLKLLGADRSGATSLTEDHYAPLVVKIKATDFKESSREENGQKLYEYMMIMNYPEEELVEGEQPATTIFLWKNEEGNFEIFDIFEAG